MTRTTGDRRVGRRAFLVGSAVAGVAATATAVLEGSAPSRHAAAAGGGGRDARASSGAVACWGPVQAGIVTPALPQQFTVFTVYAAEARAAFDVRSVCAGLGDRIRQVTAGELTQVPEPGDLTVTVAVGLQHAVTLFGEQARIAPLPVFANERIPPQHNGGDLVVQVCASDLSVAACASGWLSAWLSAARWRARWSQTGARGEQSDQGVTRNLLGFHDGIIAPKGSVELADSVWIDEPGSARPLAGATVLVVRRLRLDLAGFAALAVPRQEQIVGRRKETGVPLSGGTQDTPIDLEAKTADGRYLVPADSHARLAHPAATGRPLMLRRGYSYVNSADDAGLLFLSYQRDIGSFVQTQYRLDEGDALMRFAQATASGAFLVLPGYHADRPLGAART